MRLLRRRTVLCQKDRFRSGFGRTKRGSRRCDSYVFPLMDCITLPKSTHLIRQSGRTLRSKLLCTDVPEAETRSSTWLYVVVIAIKQTLLDHFCSEHG